MREHEVRTVAEAKHHALLELVAPRPLLVTRGSRDWSPIAYSTAEEERVVQEWAVSYAQHVYELQGAPPSHLQLLVFEGGHEFPKEVREAAYSFLELHLEDSPSKDVGTSGDRPPPSGAPGSDGAQ